MPNTLISVIMPAYNHEGYIEGAIRSIASQSYENIELLVIDDGSRDLTWQKMQGLKAFCEGRFARTIFLTRENRGLIHTLNELISLAQGEYVYVIASDDMAKPGAIEIELEFLSHNIDYGLAVGNCDIIDTDGQLCYWDAHRNIVYDKSIARYATYADCLQYYSGVDFNTNKFGSYRELFLQNHVPNGYLIRKELLDTIGPFTVDAPSEDWWLMLQISKMSKLKYIDEILFSYRWHDSNTINNNMKKIYKNARKTWEHERKLAIANPVKGFRPPRSPIAFEILAVKKELRRRLI